MKCLRDLSKVLLLAFLTIAAASTATAQTKLPSMFFWNSGGGASLAQRPAPLGNGEASTTRRMKFDTLHTLQVTTRGLRQGVRFDLKSPQDISAYLEEGFLRLRVKFSAGSGKGSRWRKWRRSRGGMPLMQPHVKQAAQKLPHFGGAPGDIPGNGFNPVPAGPPQESTPINHLLVTFVMEKGVMSTVIDIPKRGTSDTSIDMRRAHADNSGWMLFLVPLKSLHKTPNAQGNLQRVLLTSDAKDTYYVSQIGIVPASNKMSVSIRLPNEPVGSQHAMFTVKPGKLTLVADVAAGTGDPEVTWNFDADNANRKPQARPQNGPNTGPGEGSNQKPVGLRVDARGIVATHRYPNQEQNYRVQVTVHDRTGKNPDVTASVLVKVRNGTPPQ